RLRFSSIFVWRNGAAEDKPAPRGHFVKTELQIPPRCRLRSASSARNNTLRELIARVAHATPSSPRGRPAALLNRCSKRDCNTSSRPTVLTKSCHCLRSRVRSRAPISPPEKPAGTTRGCGPAPPGRGRVFRQKPSSDRPGREQEYFA